MNPSRIRLAAFAAFVLALASCGGDGVTDRDLIEAHKQSSFDLAADNVVMGYNEPSRFEKGIGLRAVAKGRYLAISVRNRTESPITLGPKSFRLILPDRQYAFDEKLDDLKGFPVVDVAPGETGLFTVGVGGLHDDLSNLGVVLNYPPAGVLLQVIAEKAEE